MNRKAGLILAGVLLLVGVVVALTVSTLLNTASDYKNANVEKATVSFEPHSSVVQLLVTFPTPPSSWHLVRIPELVCHVLSKNESNKSLLTLQSVSPIEPVAGKSETLVSFNLTDWNTDLIRSLIMDGEMQMQMDCSVSLEIKVWNIFPATVDTGFTFPIPVLGSSPVKTDLLDEIAQFVTQNKSLSLSTIEVRPMINFPPSLKSLIVNFPSLWYELGVLTSDEVDSSRPHYEAGVKAFTADLVALSQTDSPLVFELLLAGVVRNGGQVENVSLLLPIVELSKVPISDIQMAAHSIGDPSPIVDILGASHLAKLSVRGAVVEESIPASVSASVDDFVTIQAFLWLDSDPWGSISVSSPKFSMTSNMSCVEVFTPSHQEVCGGAMNMSLPSNLLSGTARMVFDLDFVGNATNRSAHLVVNGGTVGAPEVSVEADGNFSTESGILLALSANVYWIGSNDTFFGNGSLNVNTTTQKVSIGVNGGRIVSIPTYGPELEFGLTGMWNALQGVAGALSSWLNWRASRPFTIRQAVAAKVNSTTHDWSGGFAVQKSDFYVFQSNEDVLVFNNTDFELAGYANGTFNLNKVDWKGTSQNGITVNCTNASLYFDGEGSPYTLNATASATIATDYGFVVALDALGGTSTNVSLLAKADFLESTPDGLNWNLSGRYFLNSSKSSYMYLRYDAIELLGNMSLSLSNSHLRVNGTGLSNSTYYLNIGNQNYTYSSVKLTPVAMDMTAQFETKDGFLLNVSSFRLVETDRSFVNGSTLLLLDTKDQRVALLLNGSIREKPKISLATNLTYSLTSGFGMQANGSLEMDDLPLSLDGEVEFNLDTNKQQLVLGSSLLLGLQFQIIDILGRFNGTVSSSALGPLVPNVVVDAIGHISNIDHYYHSNFFGRNTSLGGLLKLNISDVNSTRLGMNLSLAAGDEKEDKIVVELSGAYDEPTGLNLTADLIKFGDLQGTAALQVNTSSSLTANKGILLKGELIGSSRIVPEHFAFDVQGDLNTTDGFLTTFAAQVNQSIAKRPFEFKTIGSLGYQSSTNLFSYNTLGQLDIHRQITFLTNSSYILVNATDHREVATTGGGLFEWESKHFSFVLTKSNVDWTQTSSDFDPPVLTSSPIVPSDSGSANVTGQLTLDWSDLLLVAARANVVVDNSLVFEGSVESVSDGWTNNSLQSALFLRSPRVVPVTFKGLANLVIDTDRQSISTSLASNLTYDQGTFYFHPYYYLVDITDIRFAANVQGSYSNPSHSFGVQLSNLNWLLDQNVTSIFESNRSQVFFRQNFNDWSGSGEFNTTIDLESSPQLLSMNVAGRSSDRSTNQLELSAALQFSENQWKLIDGNFVGRVLLPDPLTVSGKANGSVSMDLNLPARWNAEARVQGSRDSSSSTLLTPSVDVMVMTGGNLSTSRGFELLTWGQSALSGTTLERLFGGVAKVLMSFGAFVDSGAMNIRLHELFYLSIPNQLILATQNEMSLDENQVSLSASNQFDKKFTLELGNITIVFRNSSSSGTPTTAAPTGTPTTAPTGTPTTATPTTTPAPTSPPATLPPNPRPAPQTTNCGTLQPIYKLNGPKLVLSFELTPSQSSSSINSLRLDLPSRGLVSKTYNLRPISSTNTDSYVVPIPGAGISTSSTVRFGLYLEPAKELNGYTLDCSFRNNTLAPSVPVTLKVNLNVDPSEFRSKDFIASLAKVLGISEAQIRVVNFAGSNKNRRQNAATTTEVTVEISGAESVSKSQLFVAMVNTQDSQLTAAGISANSADVVVDDNSNNNSSSGGLSAGAIAGIVIGSIVGIALLVVLIVVVIQRRKKDQSAKPPNFVMF